MKKQRHMDGGIMDSGKNQPRIGLVDPAQASECVSLEATCSTLCPNHVCDPVRMLFSVACHSANNCKLYQLVANKREAYLFASGNVHDHVRQNNAFAQVQLRPGSFTIDLPSRKCDCARRGATLNVIVGPYLLDRCVGVLDVIQAIVRGFALSSHCRFAQQSNVCMPDHHILMRLRHDFKPGDFAREWGAGILRDPEKA